MQSKDERSLSKDIRELRESIDELNGLLRSIFQVAHSPARPKAKAKAQRPKTSGTPSKAKQAATSDRPPPAGNHF
tara:strand:+ start:125 stop:349 length:225 start_codon:yes stop_codon:yes gene_type:complete